VVVTEICVFSAAPIYFILGFGELYILSSKWMKDFWHSFQIREKASLRVPVEPNSDLSRLIPCGVTVTYLPSLEVVSLSVNNPVSNVLPRKIHVIWYQSFGSWYRLCCCFHWLSISFIFIDCLSSFCRCYSIRILFVLCSFCYVLAIFVLSSIFVLSFVHCSHFLIVFCLCLSNCFSLFKFCLRKNWLIAKLLNCQIAQCVYCLLTHLMNSNIWMIVKKIVTKKKFGRNLSVWYLNTKLR